MIVPGDQATGSDYSVNYVIAHEYGHHIAANRSNAPLRALDFGPKRWSSYELVCKNTMDGRLAPGDQSHLLPPEPGRGVGRGLRAADLPDPGLDASRRCCARRRARRWPCRPTCCSPGPSASRRPSTASGTRSFKLPITLDGAFTLQLDGPARTNYDIVVKSGGKVLDRTTKRNSSDRIHYRIACRDRRTENLQITVVRRSGDPAPYTLTAKYAG